jgi:hypothetical protein
MRAHNPYASIDIRLARDTSMAVISYRTRIDDGRNYSCVLSWDTSDDTFTEGQWLGGGVELCDVSPDGRYMAYIGTTFHRPVPSYWAISRPPCLTALLFEPIVSVSDCDVFFEDDFTYRFYREPIKNPVDKAYEKEGSPLLGLPWEIETERRVQTTLAAQAPIAKYGRTAMDIFRLPRRGLEIFPAAASTLMHYSTAAWDSRGRFIVAYLSCIYAFSDELPEGELLIDLSDREFKKAPPPEWALQW